MGFNKVASKSNLRPVLAEEIMRVPSSVDFSENKQCPVCGDSWDGLTCNSCGFEAPPGGLDDPNTNQNQDNPNGAKVPDDTDSQWQMDESPEEFYRGDEQKGPTPLARRERMSRFQELASSVRSAESGSPVNPNSKGRYDQRSTINLPSWGADEMAPAPVGDDDFDQTAFQGRQLLNLMDLDAPDVSGRPGDPRVTIPSRPVTRNSKRKVVSKRVARRLLADVDELVNTAQEQVEQVKDALSDLNDGSRNVETSTDLGAVDSQLEGLESTLSELSDVSGTPVEGPPEGAPAGPPEGSDDPQGITPPESNSEEPPEGESAPPEDHELSPTVAKSAARILKKVRTARRLVKNAVRVLADESLPDDDADHEVNSLIDSLEDEVGDVDHEVRQLEGDQEEDNQVDEDRKESARKALRARRVNRAKREKRLQAIREIRSARKRIAKIQLALKFADEDERADEKVEEELDDVDHELEDAESTVDELEHAQGEDERLSSRKGLFRRARKTSKSDRIKTAHTLVKSAYAKFAEEDDDGVSEDLDKADEELKTVEDDLHEDADHDDESRDDDDKDDKDDDDMREAYRRRAKRLLAELNDDGLDEPADPAETDHDADTGLHAHDDSEEADDDDDDTTTDEEMKEARKRAAARRQATNGNQETQRWDKVQDLDTNKLNTREEMMNPKRVNVTDPTEEGNQTQLADTPKFFNNGSEAGYDDQHPPSLEAYPGSEPGAYDYRSAGKEHLFRAINLVDEMISLGMVQASNKNRHIAEYERMHPSKLAGLEEAIALVKQSGARKVVASSTQVVPNSRRMPSLGRNVVASHGDSDAETYVDFL